MNETDKKYFERMAGYENPKIAGQYNDSKTEMDYLCAGLRNIAKNCLDGTLNIEESKNKISELLKKIEQTKKETIFNN